MKPAIIKLSFKQYIDACMEGEWESAISNASYDEFLLKSQAYNIERKFTTFQQMAVNDGRANSLHYKCGFPISPYISMLHNKIPGLTDNLGIPIKFDICQFTLIESDITTKYAHKFSLTYITNELTLIDATGDYMILAYGDKKEELTTLPYKTIEGSFILKILFGLSISSYLAL